jgi:two-component system, OmpR family, response regulator
MASVTAPARVLVVDDDSATRAGLCEFLERAGYCCTAAASFEAARAIVRSSPPDLLITDVRLGAFNGLQLVVGHARSTPAIVISAFDDVTLKAAAREMGATYLLKPISPSELLEKVQAALV